MIETEKEEIASHHEKHHEMERFGSEASESEQHFGSPILKSIGRREAFEILNILGKYPINSILECGCGIGDFQSYLVSRYKFACGFDISLDSIRYAKERSENVIQSDSDYLPFREKSFDAIIAKGVLHHLPDLPGSLDELRKVIPDGGFLIADEPIADTAPIRYFRKRFSQEHETWFETDNFLGMLKSAGFTIELVKRTNYFAFGFGCLFRKKLSMTRAHPVLLRILSGSIYSIDKLFRLPWLNKQNLAIIVVCRKGEKV